MNVLLVPDTIFWITGEIALSIVKHNPEINFLVCSGNVLQKILIKKPHILNKIQLVHFLCPYISKKQLKYFTGNIPVVTTIHHVSSLKEMEHNLESNAVMVVSPEWLDYFKLKGYSKPSFVLVPNGIDPGVFEPVSANQKNYLRKKIKIKDEFLIGFFGKKSSDSFGRKGVDIFLEAAKKLIGIEKKISFLIVGQGWKDVVKTLNEHKIKNIWVDYVVNHEKLSDLYNTLDCYWITSRIEGGPVTLLEAMSCGIPCITTKVGIANSIIIDGENGLLIPFNDSDKIVLQTLKLINEPTLRKKISIKSRISILNNYDIKVTSRNIKDLYSNAILDFSNSEVSSGRNIFGKIASLPNHLGNDLSSLGLQPIINSHEKNWINKEEVYYWLKLCLNSSYIEFLKTSLKLVKEDLKRTYYLFPYVVKVSFRVFTKKFLRKLFNN